MEDILQQILNSGPVGVVAAAVVYLVIWIQRNNTKKERDADSEQMKTKIALLENEVNRLKDLDLESKLAQILTDLAWLKERMK